MNSSFIDVLIGLSLVYLVFSTTCSVITEWWSRLTTARPLQLRDYVAEMLCDAHWAEQTFYGHPLIQALSTQHLKMRSGTVSQRLPSYIPERTFALTLMDLAFKEETAHHLTLRDEIPPRLKVTLHALTNCTRSSCQHTQDRLERWFKESMGRLTGRYTRYAQTAIVVASTLVTIGFNVDTLLLIKSFSLNPARTQAAVALANNLTQKSSDAGEAVSKLMPAFEKLDLPLGWPDAAWAPTNTGVEYVLAKILGWLLTISAVSLGAPFWFDVLGRFTNIRQAGPKPATGS